MRRKSGLGIVLEMMQAELEYMIELMREDDRQERQHAQEQWRAIQADTKRLKDAERRQDREFEAELDRLSKQYQVGERGKRR